MRSIFLAFLIAASALAQPTVSNVRIPTASLSHGSAQVLFDTSAVLSATACGGQFTPGASCWRLRLNTAACSGGTGGTVFTADYHAVASLQYSMAMNLSGLAPSTTYNVCPEASSNGSTWSTGVTASFTTPALPAVHPALPVAPTAFVIPASPAIGGGSCGSGSGTCAVASNCSDLQTKINTAVWGDTVTIPAGTICTGVYTIPTAPDAKSFATSAVTTSTSTIALTAHGYADQQGIRFGSSGYLPGTIVPLDPNGSGFFNANNTGGLLPGYLYYVKLVNANSFQVSLTPGGAALNFGYVVATATVSGSTITIQPGVYEQAYHSWSPAGTGTLDTSTPFQWSTTGTLPAGISLNTDYYLKTDCTNVIKCTPQISLTNGGAAVTITDVGTGTHTLTHQGTGTHYVVQWPPASSAYVTIRTASADSTLPPDGVRVSPSYQPVMATLRQDTPYTSGGATTLTTGILSHNYRFIGLEFTTAQTGASDITTTVDPRPYGNLLALGQDSGNIIFDRVYIHGLGYPDRFGKVAIVWNGFNTAIVNSYLDAWDYWHPWITGFAPTFNASSVTLATGSGYGNRTLHPVATSTTVVTITSGTATGTGNIYVDLAGVMQVRIPTGMTANCSVTGLTCNVTATGSTSIPVDGNGRIAGLKIATFGLTSGSVVSASALDPFGASESTEGSQAVIAGVGPGPYNLSNNWISGTGIPFHFDDGGNHYAMRADYTIKRNFWNTPKAQQQGHATSDGLRYGHRQPLEFKGGKRILLDGNEFTGSFMEDTRTSRIPEMTPRNGGTTTDVNYVNNIFRDSTGGISMVGAIEGLYPVSYPLLRFRVANNLFRNIDGGVANQATVQSAFDGVGTAVGTGFAREDYILDHNTIYSVAGSKPSFADIAWNTMEGFSATNNIIWVGTGTTGITFAGGEEPPGCSGLTGKAALDCAMVSGPGVPSYTFKNVMVPAGTNTEANLETIYSTLLTAAQVPTNSGAVGWVSTTLNNYRMAAASPYISGGKTSTDGLDQGANVDVLEDGLGWIKNVRPLSLATTSVTIAAHVPDSGASCRVIYGTSTDPTTWTASSADTTASQERSIAVTGLTTKTAYNYQVACAGAAPSATQNLRTL